VEPWPHVVDGAQLLVDIRHALQRHVIADVQTLTAATLWAVHTYCLDVITVSPLAHITAPEKRCGKTVLLSALHELVKHPMPASNISGAALFRAVEKWQPTLLIDEADSFLRDNEEARGLINSGLYRKNAFVIRCTGDDFEPTQFSTWGAKALCGIGRLADTIEDRSIPLRMRRKVAGESVESIRHADPALWRNLQSRITRWVADHHDQMAGVRPEPVAGLNDRANDCWESLLMIADLAGGEWPEHARGAAIALHGIEEDSPSIGVELLRDIREVFDRRNTTRMASRDLLEQLVEDDESPWATWNRGKPMTIRQLAQRLSEFGIRTKQSKAGGKNLKSYLLPDFHDVFMRYLSDEKGSGVADSPLPVAAKVADEIPRKPLPSLKGSGVADETGVAEKECVTQLERIEI
jgi:hypothetical protein